nr:unnamed protein product [Digitaria exilis]
MSAPPLMNLDTLWTTTSAPSLAGDTTTGVNVLSTTSFAPASCATLASMGISATASVGLDMVSTYTTLVSPGTTAARTAASSSASSTNVARTPDVLGRNLESSAWVPPYRHRDATTTSARDGPGMEWRTGKNGRFQ